LIFIAEGSAAEIKPTLPRIEKNGEKEDFTSKKDY